MRGLEARAILSIALIMACRMLGLFMILPFFSLYTTTLPGATPFLIGAAIGAYGFSQACLQLPMGSLSDRIGRKKTITLGLVIFALGSVVAALSHDIYGIILGRALQGAGAIGSTLLALAADLTPDERRSQAMALLGLTIALSFFVSLIVGPLLNAWLQLSGIFWLIAVLALLGLVLLHTAVPNPPQLIASTEPVQRWHTLRDPALRRLYVGIFALHAILTSCFVALPIVLQHTLHMTQHAQTEFYLIVLVLAFVCMTPAIIFAEKKRCLRRVLRGAVLLLCSALLGFALCPATSLSVGLCALAFFTAFTWLEASLPSLVSKIAPIQRKGTAMGIYSTSQFAGICAGGLIGGLCLGHFGTSGVFIGASGIALLWLGVAWRMAEPPYLKTFSFPLPASFHATSLQQLPGIAEIAVNAAQGLLHIKIDQKIINSHQLRKAIDESNLPQ